MNIACNKAMCLLVVAVLAVALPSYAGQVQTVNWNSNNINWSQLNNLLSQSNGGSPLAIIFPNQTVWNVTPQQLMQLHNSYLQQAQSMGLSSSQIPDLSFSSALAAGSNGLSLQGGANLAQLQQAMEPLLNSHRVNYQPINLGNSCPQWLQDIVNLVYLGILNIAAYIHDMFADITRR